ncbi:uncharacterized protein SOCE26_033750 [Sorangium cellulosum]|uniref:Uncharacterized protein n=1 Tax=Sorangium cellulosum TaxID=56 RepID=A0A2L0ERQ6_SORCE|nr:uncharacterized protein SOCE26_033750 [Sorangium cellulosum]
MEARGTGEALGAASVGRRAPRLRIRRAPRPGAWRAA